ncbi:unnamed protein product [Leptosia nina]|uniref:Secreted protein n=1 Tax=Leptosia nina TaxID=320188 RepID=A0AAV1J562_9NEOP
MNATVFFLVISVAVLVSCAPRTKGSDDDSHSIPHTRQHVKGQIPGIKGNPRPPPQISLRKGEYVCGDKICKLRPGEIPKGCNGICQYRI